MKNVPDDGLHFWGGKEINALLRQGVNGTNAGGEMLQEISIVLNAAKGLMGLLCALGNERPGELGDLVSIRAYAGGGDGVSQEIGVGGAKVGLAGEKFDKGLLGELTGQGGVCALCKPHPAVGS